MQALRKAQPMSKITRWSLVLVALVAIGIGVEMVYAPDPKVVQYRKDVTIAEEPTGSVTIENARKMIESETNIVLTVRIGARDLSQWWKSDTASFYVSEATPGSHYSFDPNHDPSTCPFCSRKWKVEDAMALVHLVDSTGARIPVNAPDLMNLEEGDCIVVRGTAAVDESGLLVVESKGLYVRN
jgi:hypothetical protein